MCPHTGRPYPPVFTMSAPQPPPAQAPVAAPVNSVGLQQDPGQEKKKSKFGKLGGTVSVVLVLYWWCTEEAHRWRTLRLAVSVSVRVLRLEVAL